MFCYNTSKLEMLNEIRFYTIGKRNYNLFILFIFIKKITYGTYYQTAGNINSNICLMLSVYKSYHQKGWQELHTQPPL